LCDERFIWASGPEWMVIYDTFDDSGLGSRWCLDKISTAQFADAIAERVGLVPDAVVAHMTACCHHIRFFDATYRFFRSRQLPQAIVTVNPDLFSEVIVPIYGFDSDCNVIVTSWEERTEDKRILNRLAIDRLGIDCANHEALLIDNKRTNIDDWISIGGAGYHYLGDERFARNLAAGGLDGMAAITT
jgi:hypothetical protein